MAFNIIDASKKISEKYRRYLKTMFDIKTQTTNQYSRADSKIIRSLKRDHILM